MARSATAMRKKEGIPKGEIQIRGYIEKVRFNNQQNGFSIIIISLSGESKKSAGQQNQQESQENQGTGNFFDNLLTEDQNQITCKGIMPNAKQGDEILLKGSWITDPKYGRQFSFTAFDIILPTSAQWVMAYFSGNNFYGLGRVAAEKILAALGESCLEKLKNNPDLAFSVPGLSEKQQGELAEKMREHGALGDLIAMICRHGISAGMAGRIYAKYGAESLQIVKENPYQLIKDVDGIGFDRADSIGAAVGIKKNSPFRVDAAIRHVLEEAKGEGHCARSSASISAEVLDLLGKDSGVDFGDVARAGKNLIELGELFREKKDGPEGLSLDLVYLDGMRRAEVGLADKIRAMTKKNEMPGINDEIVFPLIEKMAENSGIALAPEQLRAVIWGLKYKISVVTGGPGTGKSTITKFIVAGYESVHPGQEIYLAAPTGRAAKRLAEATQKGAKTIHRLLGYNPELGFTYDDYNQLKGPGLMILDESSMIDIELAHNLFKAIPDDMQVVIIGDQDQLPSVGPGAVLRDIIQSGVVPVTELKFIYRQSEGSTISLLADMIKNYGREIDGKKNKKMPNLRELEAMCGGRDFRFIEAETPEDVYRAVQRLITDQCAKGLNPMDFMVLTPLRDRGLASAEKLNAMLRDIVNPVDPLKKEKKFGDRVFRDGDKVMKVKKNDYNKSLFNGDIGTLEITGGDGKREEITFILDGVPIPLGTEDLAYIEPAYSYTTHKSQGSESPTVIVVCIRSHFIMLSRPIIYTGSTRGKVRLAIVGTQDAFEIAVKNNKVVRRFGLLKERLRGEI
ncbi:MAG: hypothetical protein VR68_11780 [Peptococcaceae bacterium BRH_c4a]|nr:MAG: hypothetical protein VR68_11780 [Peptococcaceae bacterium BRH_c4a]